MKRFAAEGGAVGPWLLSLGSTAGALAVTYALRDVLSPDPRGAYAFAFLATCAAALAAGATAPRWPLPAALGVPLLVAVALWAAPLSPPGLVLALGVALGLLAAGSLLGVALGARTERPGHLLAVAVMSSLVDAWSVFDPGAPSARLAADIEAAGPGALSPLVVPWPMLGTPHIDPILGAGDVVFMALYLGAARAHGLSRGRMLLALSLASVLGLALVMALARPLPLLPVLGGCVVALEPAARRLEGRERRVLGLVAVGALLALAVRWS